jgi:membrane associated rhomboid family serine protease
VEVRRQGITLFTAVCVFIAILVVIQLWLVAAALDAVLGGETGVAWPAAIASIVLCVVNAGLLRHALDFDRRLRRRDANE